MWRLLRKGAFPVVQTIPLPETDPFAEKDYEACLEVMKDRITDITLTARGDNSGTHYSLCKELDYFPKLNTLTLQCEDASEFMIWNNYEAISTKTKIKTLYIEPTHSEDFSFDTPIIPEPNMVGGNSCLKY